MLDLLDRNHARFQSCSGTIQAAEQGLKVLSVSWDFSNRTSQGLGVAAGVTIVGRESTIENQPSLGAGGWEPSALVVWKLAVV